MDARDERRTERLLLRPLRRDDEEAVTAYRSDARASRFLRHPPLAPGGYAAWFAERAPEWDLAAIGHRRFYGLEELATGGELRRIAQPVAPEFEVSACLSALAAGPALLFDDVAGSEMRIVGNVLNSRGRIAAGLGVEAGALADHLVAALAPERRLEPRLVEAALRGFDAA